MVPKIIPETEAAVTFNFHQVFLFVHIVLEWLWSIPYLSGIYKAVAYCLLYTVTMIHIFDQIHLHSIY